MSVNKINFHSELRTVRGRYKSEQYNSLAFLFSALSPVRTGEQLLTDANIETCNWLHVFDLASNRLVAPLLLSRLQKKQLTNYCPDDFIAALETFHEANNARNVRHRDILLETIRLLNQAGITPQLLKGSHALVGKMPDHNERVIGDIDLLIPIEQIKTAQTSLLEAGFYHDKLTPWITEDTNVDIEDHHLKPLFHPTGSGYIELHRFPNASQNYPNVVPTCFMPENMLAAEEEGSRFYYNHSWQLLLYNQVHHYHSAIARKSLLDIRHLSEQSALIHKIDDIKFLEECQKKVFSKKSSMSCLQFKLLAELFGHSFPKNMLAVTTKDQKHYTEVLSVLQGARTPLYKKRALLLATRMLELTQPNKFKKRVFNMGWYRSMPKRLRQFL